MVSGIPQITLFIFNLKLVILSDDKYIYIYIYNNNYILVFRNIKGGFSYSTSNKSFLILTKNPQTNTPVFNELTTNQLIKQFGVYNNLKIKFTGKGYKIKKATKNSYVFVFNRSHPVILYFRNNFFKKIKKRKISIKYAGHNIADCIPQFLKKIRYVSTYTRRGLRVSKQIIYKRRGKRT